MLVFERYFHRQSLGAAVGLPVSIIVCGTQMENLEELANAMALNPVHWWYHYMDDTHTKLDAGQGQAFTDHLNSLDIWFTTKGEEEGVSTFLDTNTVRKPDSFLKITIPPLACWRRRVRSMEDPFRRRFPCEVQPALAVPCLGWCFPRAASEALV